MKWLRSPVLYFFIFLLLLDFIVTASFEAWRSSLKEKRNPLNRRNCVEHVYKNTPRQVNETLIIIISNSQGYGDEVEDSETYPYILETKLRAVSKSPVRILNWSICGSAGPEMILLAAAAQRLNPSVVMVILSPDAFIHRLVERDEKTELLRPFASDSIQLMAYSDVRENLSKTYLKYFLRWIDRVDIYLARFYAPWRYRTLPLAFLAHFETFKFFEPNRRAYAWLDEYRGRFGLFEKSEKVDRLFDPEFFECFKETMRVFSCRHLVIVMPMKNHKDVHNRDSISDYENAVKNTDIEFHDLSFKLDDDAFITFFHLNKKGHSDMANLLAEILSS